MKRYTGKNRFGNSFVLEPILNLTELNLTSEAKLPTVLLRTALEVGLFSHHNLSENKINNNGLEN